jgi:hypothetical protein
MPFLDELVHDLTLVMDIHEDQNASHQMPIPQIKPRLLKTSIGIWTGPKSPEIRPLSKLGPPGLGNLAYREKLANDG